ncbi:hypothetical protein B0H14DRAFT_3749275 [Mycena olivaceomarginata]|nr:hypothetical protein B0H14DRAFT_3749275 [Mycena olivaceomarginata]
MLHSLLTEEKSALKEIGDGIMALDHFSDAMLKGRSPLFQQLPHLIEASGDAGLQWKYTTACIFDPVLNPLIDDMDASIEEGVRYFMAGTRPAHEALNFYNAAARYYLNSSIHKAIDFTNLALSSAQQAGELDLQLLSLETEFQIAFRVKDPYWLIAVAHKAREHVPFPSSFWGYCFTRWEAWGNCCLGNLSRALDLCTHGDEILISGGMDGSDMYLALLDIRADRASSINRLSAGHLRHVRPRYHANSLINIAYLDILTEGEGTRIVHNIETAEAIYAAYGSPRITLCSWVAAELKLFHGDTANARGAFVECLSKSLGVYPDIPLFCLAALSDPKHGMGSLLDTFRWAIVYLAFIQNPKDRIGTPHALRRLADLHAMLGDEDTALNLFHVALQAGTTMGIYRLRAECKEMWTSAQPLFIRSSRMKDAAAVERRLEQLANLHTLPAGSGRKRGSNNGL